VQVVVEREYAFGGERKQQNAVVLPFKLVWRKR
jgi:hypothetical protein